MNHDEIIETLVQCVCTDGICPPEEIQEHVASCRLCIDTLAGISELIKPGSSASWYKKIEEMFPCESIEDELDRFVMLDPKVLVAEEPAIAAHLSRCGLCAEKYVSAQRLIEAENDALFGPSIELPNKTAAKWVELKDKVFELVQGVSVQLLVDSVGFIAEGIFENPGFTTAIPANTVRSGSVSKNASAIQEAGIEISPPTISERLIVRLICEPDEQVSIEFTTQNSTVERIVIALLEADNTDSVLELRSLSEQQSKVKFERLSPAEYIIEIRGTSGTSRFPFNVTKRR